MDTKDDYGHTEASSVLDMRVDGIVITSHHIPTCAEPS